MRYFIELAFNGLSFHGWQSQPNAISVQSSVEKALSLLLKKSVAITGAGRTDSGVHARQMYAHFDSDNDITDKKRFLSSLNSLLGNNIAIRDIIPVSPNAHARFDAVERTYKYFVTYNKNPFLKNFCWKTSSLLDIDLMNEAADVLTKHKDFTSFAKLHSDVKTNICDVRKAIWLPIDKDKEATDFIGILNHGIIFTITADRFLRNMVRAIVGTLVDVGRRKISVMQFEDIINQKSRCSAGTSMPPQALFLWSVKYPYL